MLVESMIVFFCFFFFKQKTAYEMRISDWSSDVCSSDLAALKARHVIDTKAPAHSRHPGHDRRNRRPLRSCGRRVRAGAAALRLSAGAGAGVRGDQRVLALARSEDHTSELQSLMRISYAVFCLKTTSNHNTPDTNFKTNTFDHLSLL